VDTLPCSLGRPALRPSLILERRPDSKSYDGCRMSFLTDANGREPKGTSEPYKSEVCRCTARAGLRAAMSATWWRSIRPIGGGVMRQKWAEIADAAGTPEASAPSRERAPIDRVAI